jgi:hypothetical protein
MEDYLLFLIATIAWLVATMMMYEKRFMILIGYIIVAIFISFFVAYRNLRCEANITGIIAPWVIFISMVYMLESKLLLPVFENTFGNLWLFLSKAEQPIQEDLIKDALKRSIPIQGLTVVSDSILSKVNLRNFTQYLNEWKAIGLNIDPEVFQPILQKKEVISKFVWLLLTGVFVLSIINMNVSNLNMRCGAEKGDIQIWTKEEQTEESRMVNIYD